MSQASVVDQDVEPDMASNIVIILKEILNTGLRKRLISLLKASYYVYLNFAYICFGCFFFPLNHKVSICQFDILMGCHCRNIIKKRQMAWVGLILSLVFLILVDFLSGRNMYCPWKGSKLGIAFAFLLWLPAQVSNMFYWFITLLGWTFVVLLYSKRTHFHLCCPLNRLLLRNFYFLICWVTCWRVVHLLALHFTKRESWFYRWYVPFSW